VLGEGRGGEVLHARGAQLDPPEPRGARNQIHQLAAASSPGEDRVHPIQDPRDRPRSVGVLDRRELLGVREPGQIGARSAEDRDERAVHYRFASIVQESPVSPTFSNPAR
jgi:hypothetical protein